MYVAPKLDYEMYNQIRNMTARFANDVIRPQAEHLDDTAEFASDIYDQMAQMGLFGIGTPTDLGGAGMDTLAYSIVMEELSRGYASVADQCGLVELVSSLLVTHGTPEQHDMYLRPILQAKKRPAYCITEAGAGTDVSGIKTTATKTEDGWILNGEKIWIHNAPVADYAFVLARTDVDAGHRGMSIFIVDCSQDGVEKGSKENKMGQRSSQVGALFFKDVKVTEIGLLGALNKGFYMMMSVLDKGRVGIASLAVGIAQAGLEASLEYAGQRKQFNQCIGDFQGIQFILADMAKDISAARGLVEKAAIRLDNDVPATKECSMAKCFAGDIAVAQTANACQVFGGSGFIKGFEVERLYRDAKITQIYEGTNQIQRVIIARELQKNGAKVS